MKKTFTKPTKDNITYTLISFSLPLIFSGILQQLYSWADAFIVGNIEGEIALAAIGAIGTLTGFLLTLINGFIVGLSILFAQKFGAGQTDDIPKIIAIFSVILGSIFTVLPVIGIFSTPWILQIMNTPSDTLSMSKDYLQIILAGIPFLTIYNIFSAALRGIGDSRAPFLSVLLSSITNVLLDIVFVAVFHWGVAGAAVATILSQIVMTIFIIVYALRKYPMLHIPANYFNRTLLTEGARLGIPPMIQSSINAFGSLILQNFMNGFGSSTVAAITTAYRIDCILLLPVINLGSGISTIVAQNHGAGDSKRAKKVFSTGVIVMTFISLLLTALIIPVGGTLIGLFGVGEEAIKIGHGFFVRLAAFYVIFGLSTAIRGYLEGIGDVIWSSIIGILTLFCRITFSYLLVPFSGNMVIAYAEGLSWIVMLGLYVIRIQRKWRQ